VTTPQLELTGVAAGYDGAAVIRAIDVEVFPGEVVALLGPNGAGKTTILRVISGVVRPMRGTVRAVGTDAARTSPQRLVHRGVSHVAEGRSVFFGLTVAEHFRLRYRGLKSEPDEVMKYFPVLVELRNRRVGLLSGGEQQMLALACALARQPKLLLVDELSLGLAPKVVEQLLPVVRRYATDMGASVLLVEQHVHLALEIADRAIALSHGDIVLERPASELRHDHSVLVASYMGEQSRAAHAAV
jgi:branched-chain amino acid transport system ATP-binding protein